MSGRLKTGGEHFEVIKADVEHMEFVYGVILNAWFGNDGPDSKTRAGLAAVHYGDGF